MASMSNLGVRIISSLLLTAWGFSFVILNLTTRWIAIASVIVLGAWELSRLVDRKFASPHLAWLTALSVLGFCLPHYPGIHLPETWLWAMAVATLVAYVLLGFRYLDIEVIAPWVLMNGFICAYMGLWAAKNFVLTFPETGVHGAGPFLLTLFCIAAADTGAYCVGRWLGKRKLAPTISAKKTVEGALGGMVITMAVAAALAPPLVGLKPGPAAILGALLAGASIAGDLFISVIKRYCGAKDTSHLIPGHGGIMDRFDALTFSGPIAWLGLRWLGVL